MAWSLELQQALPLGRQAQGAGAAASMHMCIGIAVDDAIVDDGKLVGDGVNVAADLQQSAGHDELLVTQKVHDFVAHRSTLRSRERRSDLSAVADELGLRYLVTGSVQRAGGHGLSRRRQARRDPRISMVPPTP